MCASAQREGGPIAFGSGHHAALTNTRTPSTRAPTAACKGPEFSSAFTCTPPKCALAGDVKKLGGVCTSPLGPVSYFAENGTQITSVKCPSRSKDAVPVEPRIGDAGAACAVKGPKFSVVGERGVEPAADAALLGPCVSEGAPA
jgi:hypothetical protein